MYYKVIKNHDVIDVLDSLRYCRYQLKHKVLLTCEEKDAHGILSSDGEYAYHIAGCMNFPVDIFDTVTLEPISKQEYDRLKAFNLGSPQEVAEKLISDLVERGAI